MRATDDRSKHDVAGKLAEWQRMDRWHEQISLGNAAPIMDLIDRYERGFLGRNQLAVEIGQCVTGRILCALAEGTDWGRDHAGRERAGD
jgi:hypothetical protein